MLSREAGNALDIILFFFVKINLPSMKGRNTIMSILVLVAIGTLLIEE